MTAKRIGKKILKITGISLGVLLVLLIGFHFWFKAHAREIIEDLVESRSKGKVRLKIEKLHFNYFSRKIELEKAVFYNTDTATANTAYRFSVDRIKLEAKAILPIVFKKQLLIDSLNLLSPHIQVTRLRAGNKPDSTKKDVSIPEEMGKIYTSIQDALQVLQVKRFQIDNGTFTLINKIDPEQLPVNITNLHFHIDNLKVDTSKLSGNEKLLFSDNIVLRSHDQNILFPDGRHRLSFSSFRINLQNKLVEFDSCTIAATRTDNTATSFNVFFDTLLLSSIDFDTLYRHEVIKADSVYCINPRFDLEVEVGKKKDADKPRPKLDDIIKQLTGDLLINHVVVNNADFNIKTTKDGKPSSFTFTKNNFEMGGLAIDQDARKPVKIETFRMAIRNYENFLKDSSYQMRFDSVHLINDKIILSNFSFKQLDNGKVINSFVMPQFELTGLSWDDLIFDQKLSARDATLYNPVISYTSGFNKTQKAKRQDVFQSLAGINNLMNLESFNVLDGKIDLTTSSGVNLELEHATLFIESQSLLSSKKINELKRSVSLLNFAKGFIRVKDVTAELNNVNYNGNTESLVAKGVIFSGKDKNLSGYANDVALKSFIIDDSARSIHITGINWREADLKINIPVSTHKKNTGEEPYSILLENINTNNTKLEARIDNHFLSGYLDNFKAELFKTNTRGLPDIVNLSLKGRSLKSKDDNSLINVDEIILTDESPSVIRGMNYTSTRNNDSISFSANTVHFTPDLSAILNHDYNLKDMTMDKPVLIMRTEKNENVEKSKDQKAFSVNINSISLLQPVADVKRRSISGTTLIRWNPGADASNNLQLNGLKLSRQSNMAVSVNSIAAAINNFQFSGADGKSYTTGNGKINTQLSNIHADQQDDNTWDWKGLVSRFEAADFTLDSIGKKRGTLVINRATLTGFNLTSSALKKPAVLASANTGFHLSNFNGYYSDADKSIKWYNAGFNRDTRIFSLDSVIYLPVLSRDSFIARQKKQTDYLTARSGAIMVGPVDLDRYITDSVLHIGRAVISNVVMTDYKDKRLPFVEGVVKRLPVNIIKNLPVKIALDTLLLQQANIEYTEVNPKTSALAVVPVTRLDAKIFPVRNFNLGPTDSLRIHASAYLLDSIWLRLRVIESYTDSLGGFLMTLRMKPVDMRVLNPLLIPVASVKILSGQLDTMSMRAVGREYLSFGEMKMYYHDLKVKLLKDGDVKKNGFFSGFVNFFANTFVVKNNNTSRTGVVFYIRDRRRSAINYLLKMAMSGMSSSVGVKSTRKMIRKYKQEIIERRLPPIELE